MSTNFPNPTNPQNQCDHSANDLIEAVAFGFASDSEVEQVQAHVATCETCAQALENAQFAARALPLAVVEMDVPEEVWAGIEQRIASTDTAPESSLASPERAKQSSSFSLHWAAAALLALLTLAAGILLGRTVFESAPDAPAVPVVEVSITDPNVDATGSVHYFADQGVILLDLQNLPELPDGLVYQVWMIDGESPVSMGLFDEHSNRFAAAGKPDDFDVLAITVESGPIGSSQPTSDPLVVADLEPLREN